MQAHGSPPLVWAPSFLRHLPPDSPIAALTYRCPAQLWSAQPRLSVSRSAAAASRQPGYRSFQARHSVLAYRCPDLSRRGLKAADGSAYNAAMISPRHMIVLAAFLALSCLLISCDRSAAPPAGRDADSQDAADGQSVDPSGDSSADTTAGGDGPSDEAGLSDARG